MMSEGNFPPNDRSIVGGAYAHYFQQFEDELKKLDTQRLVEIVNGHDSVCEGCHEMAGNQAACSIEYAGLFGCMGHDTGFDPTAMPHPLPGIDAIVDATESDDKTRRQHAENALKAIEESFTRAREAAIDDIPNFLREKRGYDVGTGIQTLQGRALDKVVYGDHGAIGLHQEQAIDQHKLARTYPIRVRQILAEGHGIPSWLPVDKENMARELGEINEGLPQHTPVETVANAFIHHHDHLVAELVEHGHKESDLKYDTLADMQKQLSEESRKKARKAGGTRPGGKQKKTRRRKHKRKRQTRMQKQKRRY